MPDGQTDSVIAHHLSVYRATLTHQEETAERETRQHLGPADHLG